MIQQQTCLKVADNSGGKALMCIRVLGNSRNYGYAGDLIIGVIKDSIPHLTVKRSDVVRAVIVRTRHPLRRISGNQIRFDDNAAVVLNKDNNPRFSRIFGPVSKTLKEKGFTKVITMATEII